MTEPMNIQSGSSPFLPFSTKRSERIVKRANGRSQMRRTNVRSVGLGVCGFVTDGFTTVMNFPWWAIIAIFSLSYILSWLLFACVWTLVAFVDGHFNDTCVHDVDNFSSAFLFSIETQVTIGYGNKYVDNDCGWGIFILMLQCLAGLIIDSFMLGLIFSKLTRPRNRRKTIVFSDNAVIYDKDGDRFLEFRVCDLRRSQVVECHIRLALYWNRVVDPGATNEDDRYEFQQYDLDCGYDSGTDRILLLTPVLIRHKITESCPLYGMTQTELNNHDLEVVVILEGIVESTGLTVQALWSYTNEEIIVDRKFLPMVKRCQGKWEIDFAKVNATEPC